MQIFKDPNFDFLGKRKYFIWMSLALVAAGLASLIADGGPRYGIDFTGGALMYVKFREQPPIDKVRSVLADRVSGEVTVQDLTQSHEVLIQTELKDESDLDQVRETIIETLESNFGQPGQQKVDLNNVGRAVLADRLRDPLVQAGAGLPDEQVRELAGRILDYRDERKSGVLDSVAELKAVEGVTDPVLGVLEQQTYASEFAIRNVEIVGPKIGADLREQAMLATLYALGGMLVYIAFRFEWVYGVAAVVAVFHDVFLTIGFFSLFDKEISLTVVAALLTLVGYSMNDTIVIFDRMRENFKLHRRDDLETLMNRSVNQTLNRTILTSGLTFLTVVSLLLFGGPVLNGFAFALTVGILVGTYSSIFIASPIVLFWNQHVESRKRARVTAAVVRK